MDLTVELRRQDGVVVVGFAGDVDALSAPRMRNALLKVVAAGHRRFVCDLTRVGFLDSTGLGVLVGRLKAVRLAEGDMRVVVSSTRIRRNFKITGLDSIFSLHESVAEAVAAIRASDVS